MIIVVVFYFSLFFGSAWSYHLDCINVLSILLLLWKGAERRRRSQGEIRIERGILLSTTKAKKTINREKKPFNRFYYSPRRHQKYETTAFY